MDNKNEKSVYNKNLLWLILITLLLLLAGGVFYLYSPKSNLPSNTDSGVSGGGVINQLPSPSIGSFNIIDPSPVFKDSLFDLALINDFPSYKKSYFIDGNEICSGVENCRTKISKLGKHTLKICFDDLSLCDTININVVTGLKDSTSFKEGDEPISTDKPKPIKPGVLQTYFQDTEPDGMGDPKHFIRSENKPLGYVMDNSDDCPTRKGSPDKNGCPVVKINGNISFLIGTRATLDINYDESRPNDVINWSGEKDLYLSAMTGKVIEVSSDIVGKYRITCIINNKSDNFTNTESKILNIKIAETKLGTEFMNLAEYGNNKLLDIPELKIRMNKSEDLLDKCMEGNISLTKINTVGIMIGKSTFKQIKDELLSVKRSAESHIKKITISEISYDDNSGKIKSFKYKLN